MQTLAQEKGRGCLCGNARPVGELERHQLTQGPANLNLKFAPLAPIARTIQGELADVLMSITKGAVRP